VLVSRRLRSQVRLRGNQDSEEADGTAEATRARGCSLAHFARAPHLGGSRASHGSSPHGPDAVARREARGGQEGQPRTADGRASRGPLAAAPLMRGQALAQNARLTCSVPSCVRPGVAGRVTGPSAAIPGVC
jgi:hypothetical protein